MLPHFHHLFQAHFLAVCVAWQVSMALTIAALHRALRETVR